MNCFSFLPIVMIKHLDKRNLKEKGFILLTVQGYSLLWLAEKSLCQELKQLATVRPNAEEESEECTVH